MSDNEWYEIAPAVCELNEYANRLLIESLPITGENVRFIPKSHLNVIP